MRLSDRKHSGPSFSLDLATGKLKLPLAFQAASVEVTVARDGNVYKLVAIISGLVICSSEDCIDFAARWLTDLAAERKDISPEKLEALLRGQRRRFSTLRCDPAKPP